MVEPTQASPTAGEPPSILDIRSSQLVAERAGLPESARLDHVPDAVETLAVRLDRFEERLDQIARAVDRHAVEIGQELRRARSDRAHQAETEDARRDAAMERLRADLLAALTRAAGNGGARPGSRRPDVSADLYARLARLEAALAAVTNPILLPGEAYCSAGRVSPRGTRLGELERSRRARVLARGGLQLAASPPLRGDPR